MNWSGLDTQLWSLIKDTCRVSPRENIPIPNTISPIVGMKADIASILYPAYYRGFLGPGALDKVKVIFWDKKMKDSWAILNGSCKISEINKFIPIILLDPIRDLMFYLIFTRALLKSWSTGNVKYWGTQKLPCVKSSILVGIALVEKVDVIVMSLKFLSPYFSAYSFRV